MSDTAPEEKKTAPDGIARSLEEKERKNSGERPETKGDEPRRQYPPASPFAVHRISGRRRIRVLPPGRHGRTSGKPEPQGTGLACSAICQPTKQAEALAELDQEVAVDVLENLDPDEAAQIIAEMSPDDAADVLTSWKRGTAMSS